jgi:hypothetical protein
MVAANVLVWLSAGVFRTHHVEPFEVFALKALGFVVE